ncbi:hypothetical protein GCM10023191_067540 [Actinoallomurus oryzae]|uniref:Peptidase S53 domain-containing protein n=1 Tax=Actinoallomurus oryzae TaxID=502180 RepID=A0ABP8QQE2_9ACTN
MRLRRLVTLAAAISLGIGVLAAPAQAAPPPTASQAAEPLPGMPRPDHTPAACNRVDLPAGHAHCFLEVYTPEQAKIAAKAETPPSTALTPEDIRSAYHLPDGGKGQTVAIVDAYGYSVAESDLAVFRAEYGLPECSTANGCFRKVDQNGGTDFPGNDAGWEAESALDLDAVSAVCPHCDILLVEANSASIKDLSTAADTAVALGAKFVSNSYGIPGEADGEQAYDDRYDHPGVVVTASTGDTGNLNSWPAGNPNVVAVGGTKLVRDTSTDRGWSESAWADGGSGCSPYEPRPDYQGGIETNCPSGRATADIAADADPSSGLAVYHSITSDGHTGWVQYGGTSLSAPLVAAMYALAGTPATGTYPVTYPYSAAGSADLFDVSQGVNGTCGNVLCQAGPGWDGPTGLGSPNGVKGLAFGPAGTVTGHLTDQSAGKPVTNGEITARNDDNGRTYHTGADGQGAYTLVLPAGTYTLTASGFGYAKATKSGVVVTTGQTVTADIPMKTTPSRTVSGKITGDTDHAWPLAASITIDGYPDGTVKTDPYTGRYTVKLPLDADYTFHIAADYPGYTTKVQRVSVGDKDTSADAALAVDRKPCTAPGYAYPARVDFEGWTGTTPQDGWTVSGSTPGWEFTGNPANLTGATGDFAGAAPFVHDGTAQDTYLTSPKIDLSGQSAPQIRFDNAYVPSDDSTVGDVQLSLDGGANWTTVGHPIADFAAPTSIAIPQAAGRSDVRVRFHYAGRGVSTWQLDNVTVGACTARPGGLVSGTVTDANTGRPVSGATVDGSTPSTAEGWFWTFAGTARKTRLTASADRYASSTGTVKVAPDAVTRHDWSLRAGRLSLSTTAVSVDTTLGRAGRTQKVRLTNTGGAPLRVSIGEHGATAGSSAVPQGTAWTEIPEYPFPVMSNTVGSHQGKVYSVGGVTPGKALSAGYVYDPAAGTWSPIADLPQPLYNAAGIFLDGTMYVVGGSHGAAPSSTVYAYHPASDRWTRLADLPTPVDRGAVAVLGDRLYVVGGCVEDCLKSSSAAVYRYDPQRDRWARAADYPMSVEGEACAGVGDQIICAGGVSKASASAPFVSHTETYAYSPRRNTWTRLADMPYNAYYMAYGGANGRLQVAGGVNHQAATDRAAEFDPVAGTWHALPSMRHAAYYVGSSCGLYKIGGVGGDPSPVGEVLPGYDSCGGDDVSWLKENRTRFELAPGHSATLMITTNARVSVPGRYAARLSLDTDSPYQHGTVDVSMKVTARRSQGR